MNDPSCHAPGAVGHAPVRRLLLALSSIGVLGGCSTGAPPAAGSPEATLQAASAALARGQVSECVRVVFAPAQLDELRATWDRDRVVPVKSSFDAEVRRVMKMLTEAGAEQKLFDLLEPQLEFIAGEAEGLTLTLPMLMQGAGGMGGAGFSVTEELFEGLIDRVPELGLSDPEKLRRAIGKVTEAARRVGVADMQGLAALEFDALLAKADIVYGALADVLEVYELSLAETFESLQFQAVTSTSDKAQIAVTFTLFDGPSQSTTIPMRRVGDRWSVGE